MTQQPIILMCVGAAKAGTSWLFDQLAGHPQCHLRGIKELHYFDTAHHGQWAAETQRIERRVLRSRGALLADLVDWLAVLQRGRLSLRAYLDYLTAGRGDKRVVADFTPSYSLLPQRILSRLFALGQVKMLYLLRDPVERLWSHVRMDAQRMSRSAADAARMFGRALNGRGAAIQRSDYAQSLSRLDAAAPKDALMVGFYEELMTPGMMDRLARFLGISPIRAEYDVRVHEGQAMVLPSDLRARAIEVLRPQYEFVARRMGSLPRAWCAQMTEV
ncbi:sulfotransferase [Falsirhodobacter sp. alg1]|uniref:sulfotransferase n=1 Tax=Falsirhodobacter sp. alg1 TaxID=1472418 RepID=UPI0005EF1EB0|nr:sulfotransferase [Falsirhodobacter sp. alg1]